MKPLDELVAGQGAGAACARGAVDMAGARSTGIVVDEVGAGDKIRSVDNYWRGRACQRIHRRRLKVRAKCRTVLRINIAIDVGLVRQAFPSGHKVRKLIVMLHPVQWNLDAKRLQSAGKAGISGVGTGAAELRNHDRRENSQNDHDDQDLDQRETRTSGLKAHILLR